MKLAVLPGLAAAVLLLAACSTAGSPQAAATRTPAARPVVYDCAGKAAARPASYTLACADAGIALSKVTWSAWSAGGAKGSGLLAVNKCQPTCAAGKFTDTPVTLTLSGPHAGAGRPYFTHLAISGRSVQAGMRTWTLGTRGPS